MRFSDDADPPSGCFSSIEENNRGKKKRKEAAGSVFRIMLDFFYSIVSNKQSSV